MTLPGIDDNYRNRPWHFAPGDSVRFVRIPDRDYGGQGQAATADYARHGVLPGRVLTVKHNGGTFNPNGVVSFEGTSGAFRARYFELVKRATVPLTSADIAGGSINGERVRPMFDVFGTGTVEVGMHRMRLRGFLVRHPHKGTPTAFVAPLPGGGYTVISGPEGLAEVAFTPDESETT